MAPNSKIAKKKFGTPRVPLKLTPTPEQAPGPPALTPAPLVRTAAPGDAPAVSVGPAAPTRAPSVSAPWGRISALAVRIPVLWNRKPFVSVRTPAPSKLVPTLERGPATPILTPTLERDSAPSVRTSTPSELTPAPERDPALSVRTLDPERALPPWKATSAPLKRTTTPERAPSPERGPLRYRVRINRAPVLDRAQVQELARKVQSQARLIEFLNLFLVLLPSRVANVVRALEAKDQSAASVAARSLASSASMAGATRLQLVALLVEDDLREGRLDRARQTGRRLSPDASELASALSRLLTGS